MRVEVIRESGDSLQKVVETACAIREASSCTVIISTDAMPIAQNAPVLPFYRRAQRPVPFNGYDYRCAEIPFAKPHLQHQQVTKRKKQRVRMDTVLETVLWMLGAVFGWLLVEAWRRWA